MNPEISVVILLSGWGETEKRSVESVLSQDIGRERMEIIAVAKQQSEDMADYFAVHDIQVHTERSEGLGAMAAAGIEMCGAPVITFLEGGDLFTPDRVSQSAELIDEDERNMYHHSSIIPVNTRGEKAPDVHFKNINYDLYTSQDDVPFAFPQVMRANAARHLSAITCRREALQSYVNLISTIRQSVDIAILAVCLQYGGRSMFDSAPRTKCIVKSVDPENQLETSQLLEEEKKFHIGRIADMERVERALTQQRALDIARAEKIYSRIALSFISEEPEHQLSASTSMHYMVIGMFEHFKEFRPLMRANLLGKSSRRRARDKFIKRMFLEPWNMRM